MPQLPTVHEAGVPGYELGWFGLLAPARTPQNVVDRLASEVEAVADPQIEGAPHRAGAGCFGSSSDEMLAVMRADTKKWAEVIAATGAKIPMIPMTCRSNRSTSMAEGITGWRLHVGVIFPTPVPPRAVLEFYEAVPEGIDMTTVSLTIQQLSDDAMDEAIKGMERAAKQLANFDVDVIYQSGVPPVVNGLGFGDELADRCRRRPACRRSPTCRA